MRRALEPAVLSLLLSLLAGCGVVGDGIDRPAYYAARDVVSTRFAPDGGRPPPWLGDPPGTAFSDLEGAARAMLTVANAADDPLLLSAARFMARQVADPARLCGPVEGEPMADLLLPEALRLWQRDAVDETGSPYVIFSDCATEGVFLTFADMRVTGARLLRAGPSPGYVGDGVRVAVDMLYLIPGPRGVRPVTQTRSGFVYVDTRAPHRLGGTPELRWSTGPGFGEAGLPEFGTFASAGDTTSIEAGAPQAEAAVAVTTALAATLTAASASLRFTRDIGRIGERRTTYAGQGSIYPAAGALLLDLPEAPAGEIRVLDGGRVFSRNFETGDDGEPDRDWRLVDGGVAPRNRSEVPNSPNLFARLDWIGHLAAASPVDCAALGGEDIGAAHCYAVRTRTTATLTPGTPGYRDAVAQASRGNAWLDLQVAVLDGRLAAIRADQSFDRPGALGFTSTTLWWISDYADASVPLPLVPPPSFAES